MSYSMTHTPNLAARSALRRRHAAMQGLGNPYLVGAWSAIFTLLYMLYATMTELEEEKKGNSIPACDPSDPKYNFDKCQKYRAAKESASALTAGGVIDTANAQRAIDILRMGGFDVSRLDLSGLSDSFSFSIGDLAGALSSIPTSVRPGQMSDGAIAAVLGAGASSDVYDAPPPADGAAAAVANASPAQMAIGALVVLGIGYAAYKYL